MGLVIGLVVLAGTIILYRKINVFIIGASHALDSVEKVADRVGSESRVAFGLGSAIGFLSGLFRRRKQTGSE